jgi:hypothetical protein
VDARPADALAAVQAGGGRLMAKTRNIFGLPESPQETKARDLRESGYKGPIDQDGDKAKVVGKGRDLLIVKER